MYTIHMIDQDRQWQQFGTIPIVIGAPQWLHRAYNAPWQFYRVSKKPSVKADLVIYSHELDVSGWCMGVLLIINIEIDFSSCANWDSFCKSSHIFRDFIFIYKLVDSSLSKNQAPIS